MNESSSPSIEVNPHDHPPAHQADILTPDVEMMIFTWVTFFLLLAILYKYAWKPILLALDAREEHIRKSLEEAQKAHEQLEQVKLTTNKMLSEADEKAKHIVERAQKAAVEAARVIEKKTREEAHILMTNASQEVAKLVEKAQVQLRRESVSAAVTLATKIMEEELDKSRQEKLIDKYIQEFDPEQ